MDARVAGDLHARGLVFTVAEQDALQRAGALVAEVYEQRLSLHTEASEEPLPADTRVLLVHDEGGAVATLTLQSAGFAAGYRSPLELEQTYRLGSLGIPRQNLAEVRRVAARFGSLGAVRLLYRGAAALCLGHGIQYFLGLVESGDQIDAVPALWRRFEQAGLIDAERTLRPHADASAKEAELRRYCGPMSEALPVRVRCFARDLNAKVCGLPTCHPRFPSRLVTPMCASLAALVSDPNAAQGKD